MELKAGEKKKIAEFVLVFFIFILLILLIYFIVYQDIFAIFTVDCMDKDCFNLQLSRCRRARYVNDADEATWIYTIMGRAEQNCKVGTELANVKQGSMDLKAAEGLYMNCYIPLGLVAVPGDDLTLCTGKLKEQMQDLIIKKMHAYILENLGQINNELTNGSQL